MGRIPSCDILSFIMQIGGREVNSDGLVIFSAFLYSGVRERMRRGYP